MAAQPHPMVDLTDPPRAVPTGSRAPGRRRLTVNISPPERAGRVLIGAAAAIAGVVLLTAAGSALAIVLELLLIVAGLALVVTGALGYCPLYPHPGHGSASLRRPI